MSTLCSFTRNNQPHFLRFFMPLNKGTHHNGESQFNYCSIKINSFVNACESSESPIRTHFDEMILVAQCVNELRTTISSGKPLKRFECDFVAYDTKCNGLQCFCSVCPMSINQRWLYSNFPQFSLIFGHLFIEKGIKVKQTGMFSCGKDSFKMNNHRWPQLGSIETLANEIKFWKISISNIIDQME